MLHDRILGKKALSEFVSIQGVKSFQSNSTSLAAQELLFTGFPILLKGNLVPMQTSRIPHTSCTEMFEFGFFDMVDGR